jgi:hypothetical protein
MDGNGDGGPTALPIKRTDTTNKINNKKKKKTTTTTT